MAKWCFYDWGFKGRKNYEDYKDTANPIRGKIYYRDSGNGSVSSGNIDACDWNERDGPTDIASRYWYQHPNAKVDDSGRYVFYYSRGYKIKGVSNTFKSYSNLKNDARAGLIFFKIGNTSTSLSVTPTAVSYAKLIGSGKDSDIESDTWFDSFKQSNPRGYQGSRSEWVNGFAKWLPPDVSNPNTYYEYGVYGNNSDYWKTSGTAFDIFTLKGNFIYGECSSFGAPFNSEIYKVRFSGNKRIEWPDIQSVTSYDVTYKSYESSVSYNNLQAGVSNKYYDHNNTDLPGDDYVGAGVSKVLVKYQVPIQTDYVESTAIQPYHNTPQNVSLTAANNEVTLTYDNIPVPARFKIEKQNNEGVFTTLTDTNSLTTYTDSALSPGNAYFYRISLSDDNGTTFYNTVTKSVVVSILGPSITSTLNDKTISLTWEGLGNKFDIQRSENGGNFTDLDGAQDLIVKQYDNTNLVYDTDYKYRIKGKEFDVSFNVIPTTAGEDYLVKNITIPQQFFYEETMYILPVISTNNYKQSIRVNYSLVKFNNHLISVGGVWIGKNNQYYDTYDTWRERPIIGGIGDGYYMFRQGGYTSTDKYMRSYYDEPDSWPNTSQRSYTFVYNNKMYSFLGGDTTQNFTNKILTSSDFDNNGSMTYNKTYTMAGTNIINSTPKVHGVSAHNHKKYLYTFGGVKKINGVSKLRRYDLDAEEWSPYNSSDHDDWITIPTSLEDTPQNCNLVYVNTTSFPETLFVFGGNLNSQKIWSIDIANFADKNYKEDSARFVEQTFDSTGLTFQSENIDWKNYYENLPFQNNTYINEKNGFVILKLLYMMIDGLYSQHH